MSLNFPMGRSVESRYKIYVLKVKHTKYVYMVRQLPTSTGLCSNARISTNMIQG